MNKYGVKLECCSKKSILYENIIYAKNIDSEKRMEGA